LELRRERQGRRIKAGCSKRKGRPSIEANRLLQQNLQLAEVIRSSSPQPADVDRVFEAFYTTKLGGLGLGLSICRSIIEAHNGRLWASANRPRGASFQFALPAIASPASC
jgi:signal transduction histidine kinase